MNYILIFILAGLFWLGLAMLGIAVFAGIRKVRTPKPPKETIWRA